MSTSSQLAVFNFRRLVSFLKISCHPTDMKQQEVMVLTLGPGIMVEVNVLVNCSVTRLERTTPGWDIMPVTVKRTASHCCQGPQSHGFEFSASAPSANLLVARPAKVDDYKKDRCWHEVCLSNHLI